MADEIQPALTPGEWAEFLGGSSGDDLDEAERWMRVNQLRRSMAEAALTARRYTAAAAIALHAQRGGFTWEDVDELLAAARAHERGAAPAVSPQYTDEDRAWHRERAEWIRDLARRIAALLPPHEGSDPARIAGLMRGHAPARTSPSIVGPDSCALDNHDVPPRPVPPH